MENIHGGDVPVVCSFALTDKMWACPACSLHNHKQVWKCEACNQRCPDQAEWWEKNQDAAEWRRISKNDDAKPPADPLIQPKSKDVKQKRTGEPKNKKQARAMAKQKAEDEDAKAKANETP